ncbi:hypothetical protein CERSUDRAFT_154305 [Gelatoporia subvermispora B]|uniref:DUF6533 domain-containing protein n=1 Tax=Ceriporiopsis subvermispora (strain B) TaxID=914234 RepID=M2RGJ9_CERS8|nr:hypothetical protein CERSUDRAFT_154305 [Gelatoporia subvermispora B]
MSANIPPGESLTTTADHLLAAKLYSLASCVMLFYDIALTFGDEVEKIWKQRFTGATVLWFMNRYLSPLGYIVIIVSFNDPNWGKSACNHYVLYPEALKIVTASAVGTIFILRLYSIYSRSNKILVCFTLLLLAELGTKIWAFTDGTALQLPPELVGCILTGKSAPGKRIVYTWVAELVFDSIVFFATLYRTLSLYRSTHISEAQSLIGLIMRDGIMYFAVIFMSNLITVLIFLLAPDDLKVINASFSTLITSLMVSRLMLNLRGEVMRRKPSVIRYRPSETTTSMRHIPVYHSDASSPSSKPYDFTSSVIGNLGEPMALWTDSDDEEDFGHAFSHASYATADDGAESMEMRTPSRLGVMVEVTEEVVVDHPPLPSPSRSRVDGRRSWMPPAAWRVSRDWGERPSTS